jgi:hypothetical protein
MLTSELAQKNTVIQQMAETLIDEQHLPINLSVLQLLGLRLQKRNASKMKVSNKRFFHFHVIKNEGIGEQHQVAYDPPIVNLSVSVKEVWRRTGF